MESLLKDIRYGLRALVKSRGFTVVAVLSLAIGIGANTAIFSLANAALIRPLPYKNPDSLIMLMRESRQPGKETLSSTVWSYSKFEVLRDANQTLEQVAAVSQQNFPLADTMVAGRTREIGIRQATGARAGDVMKMILSDVVVITIAGIAVGIAAAFALTRLIASQLYEVTATDPATFAIVSLILAGVALGACFISARRATRVDPMVALRHD